MIKQDNRRASCFNGICNFLGLSFTDKVLGVRCLTATCDDLQRLYTCRRNQRFEFAQVFCVFVSREIDMNQYGLLTGFITVKQADDLSLGEKLPARGT